MFNILRFRVLQTKYERAVPVFCLFLETVKPPESPPLRVGSAARASDCDICVVSVGHGREMDKFCVLVSTP